MGKYKYSRDEMTTVPEIKITIEKARWPWLKSIIAFLYLYGTRITEALYLKKKDFWVEEGNLAVRIGLLKRRQKPTGPYVDVPHVLRISLKSPFMDLLINYVELCADPNAYLWPVSRQLVWRRMKEVNPNISPHVFRHDRLTKLAMAGASEMELMDWAGWNDPRPASVYIQSTGRLASKYADKVK